MRKVQENKKKLHYCIFVNQKAANYNSSPIKKLTAEIRKKGDNYTIFEPDTAFNLMNTALKAVGIKKWHREVPKTFLQRGKVSTLVACGGDGTVNLVARAALNADLPVAIIPMGKFNNIARSLNKDISADSAPKIILKNKYRKIDSGKIGEQLFFGSAAIRFTPALQQLLADSSLSRFAFKWGQHASKVVTDIKAEKLIVKIDAFRFEVSPTILNINLLSHSVGIPFSNSSIPDDSHAEVILDFENNKKNISQFVRQLYKEKYLYNNEFKLFRGQNISIQPVKGETLYLDGELVELPNEVLNIEIMDKQLKIIC